MDVRHYSNAVSAIESHVAALAVRTAELDYCDVECECPATSSNPVNSASEGECSGLRH
jgi:hypothetical protein